MKWMFLHYVHAFLCICTLVSFNDGEHFSGKRQESLQFELLYCQYIRLMEHHKQYVKPALLRDMICRGLAQYPNNGQLLNAYIRCSSSTSCTNNLRRFFDDMLHK